MMETYKVTDKGTLVRADDKLARAEQAITRSYIDVSDRFEAAEAAEEVLELVGEVRRTLRQLQGGSKWSTPRDTRRRSRDASE